jgi:hypothetical protein
VKLQTLLPIASLVSGLIAFAPGAQAQQNCKYTTEWQACFYPSSGSYSIRFRDGSGIDGQCGDGIRRSSSVPFALASEVHYRFCGSPLQIN